MNSESARQEQDGEATCKISADEIFLLTCKAISHDSSNPVEGEPTQLEPLEYVDMKSILD